MRNANSQAISLGLHAVALGILLLLTSRSVESPPRANRVVSVLEPLRWQRPAAVKNSGGSNRTALPARHGAPPPKAHRTFIPPRVPLDSKLPMPITVAFASPTQIDPAAVGDPMSRLLEGALGANGGIGIGDWAHGPGIGTGGSGPPGISSNAAVRSVTAPVLIFQVEPEFSEEARKAKYQGMVLLAIDVDASGHPTNIRVLQGLGMGLDKKAIEAVSRWRFRPGLRDGKPVVTSATVQVSFRLL